MAIVRPLQDLFNLDPAQAEPLYRQLMAQVRRLVVSAQLPAGAEMPSVRDLALAFAINPMTVSKAYSLLEAEGLLIRQRGARMTVAVREAEGHPLSQRLGLLQPVISALFQQARELDLDAADLSRHLNHCLARDYR